jgi:hypothetical protein
MRAIILPESLRRQGAFPFLKELARAWHAEDACFPLAKRGHDFSAAWAKRSEIFA